MNSTLDNATGQESAPVVAAVTTHAARFFGLPWLYRLAQDNLGVVQRLKDDCGDVVRLRIGGDWYYWIFDPTLARRVLVEHDDAIIKEERQIEVFQSAQGENVLTTEGEVWKRQRRILMPAFMPKKIAGYLGLMARASADTCAELLPREAGADRLVDVDGFTTRLTMDVILRVLFSHRASARESQGASAAIRRLSHQGMREFFWPKTPPDWFPHPGRADKLRDRETLHRLVREQIALRRTALDSASAEGSASRAVPNDLLTMLLAAHDEEAASSDDVSSLTNKEIFDNCLVIFLAGHDTSATALTWWIGLMTQHPDYVARVRAEIAGLFDRGVPPPEQLAGLVWLNATLKEAMRLYPPVIATFARRVIGDMPMGGDRVPRRAVVNIPIWQIQHDPRWFSEPEAFRPERFMDGAPKIPRGAYLPFGAGPHVCLGQHFAMLEMALIGAMLIDQFDFFFESGQLLPEPQVDITLKPKTPLLVKFVRRQGAQRFC